jgi:hypothetical protein
MDIPPYQLRILSGKSQMKTVITLRIERKAVRREKRLGKTCL